MSHIIGSHFSDILPGLPHCWFGIKHH